MSDKIITTKPRAVCLSCGQAHESRYCADTEENRRMAVGRWFSDNGFSYPVESEISDLLKRIDDAAAVLPFGRFHGG